MTLPGDLFVVVAPSGAGKTSLVNRLLEAQSGIRLSVSHTTRAPRPGEEEGRDYHFVDRATFENMIAAGDFLEHADVYGNYYGTSRRSTGRAPGRCESSSPAWSGSSSCPTRSPSFAAASRPAERTPRRPSSAAWRAPAKRSRMFLNLNI
jgi:hypothetical protein